MYYQLCVLVACVATSMSAVAAPATILAEKRIYVDHGDYADIDNPQCRAPGQDNPSNVIIGLAAGSIPSLDKAIGTLLELTLPQVSKATSGSGGDLGRIFAPNRYSNCVTLIMAVPDGVEVVDVQGFTDEGPCVYIEGAYHKCAAGWSAWTWAVRDKRVVATFKNWSGDRARNATLRVYGKSSPGA
jgi:hypothetical protein